MIKASMCKLHYPYIKRYRQHESNKVVFIQTRRIFAFTRGFCWKQTSFLGLHLPKFFFMQLLVYLVTVFSLGMPEMQLSHICMQS